MSFTRKIEIKLTIKQILIRKIFGNYMMNQKKKLEILDISDIKESYNDNFSQKTNHYLQNLLFDLRLVFRYNLYNLEDLIDLYCYIEDILNNNIIIDEEELKILIYRLTDLVLNIEQYELKGEILIIETVSNLQQSLYNEIEQMKIKNKLSCDNQYATILDKQLKNQDSEFNLLIDILNQNDIVSIKKLVNQILEDNYKQEYQTYKARNKCYKY